MALAPMNQTHEPPLDDVRPDTIWLYRQNKPTYVARDLERFGVPRGIVYRVLMARGVFKWLAVRRDLIKLKNLWRMQLADAHGRLRLAKMERNRDEIARLRGVLETLAMCRQQVRGLCHGPRWRAPDFDGDAWRWMAGIAPGEDVPDSLRRDLRLANRDGRS